MSALLDFFVAGPARVKGLLLGAMAIAVACLALTTWALVERVGAVQARAERDRALDQVAVVAAAAKACSAGVDQAKRAGDAAVEATGKLAAAAARLAVPAKTIVERTEKIIERTVSTPTAGDCNAAWLELEQARQKARAP